MTKNNVLMRIGKLFGMNENISFLLFVYYIYLLLNIFTSYVSLGIIYSCNQTKMLKSLFEQTMFHVAVFLSSRIRIHHDPNFSKKYGDKYTLRIYLV